jgi:GR25 family glycosyltransferase involved in LPS biosynthesis
MKTYICHWSKLVDRKNNLLPVLESQGFSDVEWVESYDTETWDREEIEKEYPNVFGLTPGNRWNSTRRHLKHSEISLLLKHCYIIEQIAKSDDPYGLVLEDDVVFYLNFKNILPKCLQIGILVGLEIVAI